MRHLLLLLVFVPIIGIAQNTDCEKDTTLYFNGRKIVIKEQADKVKVNLYESKSDGDTITNTQIFEGIYLNGQNSEKRSIFGSFPFSKKRKERSTNHYFQEHVQGVYLGYTRLSNDFCSFTPSGNAHLNGTYSWEIGGTLFAGHITLTPSNKWGITAGLGWGYRSMRLDGNYAFREVEGMTHIYPGDTAEEPVEYAKSRLRYFFFRIPLSLEWQTPTNTGKPVYFTVGPEAEIRHGVKSKGKRNGSKETFDKGLYVRPVSINLLLQAGYGSWGIYTRYSTMNLFENRKGPELYPFSFGLCWFWR